MAKITLEQLVKADKALKESGITISKNVTIILGVQSPEAPLPGGNAKPEVKGKPGPKAAAAAKTE
jgi:hypothetical protein